MSSSSQDALDTLPAPGWALSLARWAVDRVGQDRLRRGLPVVVESPRTPLLRPSRTAPKNPKPTIIIRNHSDPEESLFVLFETNHRAMDLLRPKQAFEISDYRRYARAALLLTLSPRGEIRVLDWRATGNCARQLEKALWPQSRAAKDAA